MFPKILLLTVENLMTTIKIDNKIENKNYKKIIMKINKKTERLCGSVKDNLVI